MQNSGTGTVSKKPRSRKPEAGSCYIFHPSTMARANASHALKNVLRKNFIATQLTKQCSLFFKKYISRIWMGLNDGWKLVRSLSVSWEMSRFWLTAEIWDLQNLLRTEKWAEILTDIWETVENFIDNWDSSRSSFSLSRLPHRILFQWFVSHFGTKKLLKTGYLLIGKDANSVTGRKKLSLRR